MTTALNPTLPRPPPQTLSPTKTEIRSSRHRQNRHEQGDLEQQEQEQEPPLASPPTSPLHPQYTATQPERAVYHSPHSPPAHRYENHQHQYQQQHQRGESHSGHAGETDPMLQHGQDPAYPSPTHQHHSRTHTHHAVLPVTEPSAEIHGPGVGCDEESGDAPPPPPKSPRDGVSLSRRLFHALVHKPTLSRTWEQKRFMAEQGAGSAHEGVEIVLERYGFREYASPRSRPMSLYASPAEIAAFRPLPLTLDPPRT